MEQWMKVAGAALPVAILLVLLCVFLRRCCISKQQRDFTNTTPVKAESLQSGIAKLHLALDATNNHKNLANFHHHHHHHNDLDYKRMANYYVFRRAVLSNPLFDWADHPSLVSEAVEFGWSRFAFTGYISSSQSTRSKLLGLCAACDQGREREVEISWEVSPGSADFMQQIRFNLELKKINMGTPPSGVSCVIKSALPLPGPPLGKISSFPQEAYFEITILSSPEEVESTSEGERIKLISEMGDVKVAQSDSLVHVTSRKDTKKLEGLKLGSKKEAKREAVMLSVGLTSVGSSPSKIPGSYHGSIGFNSNGSVYLDGIKLVFESEKAEWGSRDKVIGCGFEPSTKKVFFTVDSELVHVIHCKSEEFGSPLYPTLAAANVEAAVLVNFGQSAFSYTPANVQRTPNPCFIGHLSNSPAAALGYEDSRELFSMGRLDSQWLNRSATRNNYNSDSVSVDIDMESETETELFEIVLDNSSRSTSKTV